MGAKSEEADNKKVASAVRDAERDNNFTCPECRRRRGPVVLNPEHGYVCADCDWVIRLTD